jgi:hypothetical protein
MGTRIRTGTQTGTEIAIGTRTAAGIGTKVGLNLYLCRLIWFNDSIPVPVNLASNR